MRDREKEREKSSLLGGRWAILYMTHLLLSYCQSLLPGDIEKVESISYLEEGDPELPWLL